VVGVGKTYATIWMDGWMDEFFKKSIQTPPEICFQ